MDRASYGIETAPAELVALVRCGGRQAQSGAWAGCALPRYGLGWLAVAAGQMSGTGSPLRYMTIWLANRGVWEALPGAGPTVPVPATHADVTRYVEAYSELLAALR